MTNLSRTTSFSANYLDQTNVSKCIAQGRAKLPHRDAGSSRHSNLQSLLDLLDEIEWPPLEEDLQPADQLPQPGEAMVGMFPEHERIAYSKPVVLGAPS